MSVQDPFTARLSEYLDGELGPEERRAVDAHLAGCARCRAVLADLGELAAAARALPAAPPPRELWPGIERRLGPVARAAPGASRPRPWSLVAAFAAGLLVALAAFRAFERPSAEAPERVARGEPYLLLLHEPVDLGADWSAEEGAAVAARYAAWARELGARCAGGEELAPGGVRVAPGAEPEPIPAGAAPDRIGGFFLLEVGDEAEAVALARTCPHLDHGGWIEVRPITRR